MQLPTGASRFVFIFAHPAAHVSAPRYYSPYFRDHGLDWHMVPLDVAPVHLVETIRVLARSESVAGFNLTMPHKPAAFELCDAVGPAATFEGVVNTIRIEAHGRLVGDSFDGGGFLNAAREAGVFDPERRCVVIGAGGAGARSAMRWPRPASSASAFSTRRRHRSKPWRQSCAASSRSFRSAWKTNSTTRACSSTRRRLGCTRPMRCRWTRRDCRATARCSTSSPPAAPSS
jgi:shikimate 5-dehydrogenase